MDFGGGHAKKNDNIDIKAHLWKYMSWLHKMHQPWLQYIFALCRFPGSNEVIWLHMF